MHELGVVQSVINTLEGVAREQHLVEIGSVTLEIGEVNTVVPEFLVDAWKYWKKKSEILKDAELIIDRTPAVTVCEDCGQTYETVKYAKICPYCKSDKTHLVTGNEFNIKEITAR